LDAENICEHARRMVARINVVVYAFDDTLLADEKADALRSARRAVGASTISRRDRMVTVAQKRKSEIMLAREGGVTLGRIEADSDDSDILLIVIRLRAPEAAAFQAASRCARLGKEPQKNFAAAQAR